MAKTFKEVAHHYIGCSIDVSQTEWGQQNADRLTSVVLIGTAKNEDGDVTLWLRHNITTQNNGNVWLSTEVCTPLLRDMESMSDEEAIGLCAIVQPLPFLSPRKNKWTCQRTVYNDGEVFILVQCETNDYSFQIDCTDGEVSTYRFDEMEGGSGCAAPFDYLCRHSFNVFNLPSTEYIKINQQQK